MKKHLLCTLLLITGSVLADPAPPPPLDATKFKSIAVKVGGKPFTSFIYQGVPKPVLFPIVGPYGLEMTRNYPLRPALANEEQDHPHHQSLWFAHGDINGIDFWSVAPKAGTVVVQGEPEVAEKDGATTIKSAEHWMNAEGKLILTSHTSITCSGSGEYRIIDYATTLHASQSELTFGDTKEGTMALRVRPELNLPSKKGLATIVNSAGQTGEEVWGKPAAWVDYSAPIEGHTVGIACFDHPGNLRHPTTWHARDYGLFAANPFGLHDFQKVPVGQGKHVLEKDASLTFRYRWVFHPGNAEEARLDEAFKSWAESTK